MPHRSISLLVLMGLVALLTGGVLTALNKPQVGIDAGSLFAPVVEVSKVGPVGQAESSAAGAVSDPAVPAASSPDCPCPGECGAAEHYRQLEH